MACFNGKRAEQFTGTNAGVTNPNREYPCTLHAPQRIQHRTIGTKLTEDGFTLRLIGEHFADAELSPITERQNQLRAGPSD